MDSISFQTGKLSVVGSLGFKTVVAPLHSAIFSFNSSFLVPCNSLYNQENTLTGFARTLVKMMENRHWQVFVSGHSDPTGSDAVNDKLSKSRAAVVYALLSGDEVLFSDHVLCPHISDRTKKKKVLDPDLNLFLDWVALRMHWDCHVVGNQGNEQALRNFQIAYNGWARSTLETAKPVLEPDGILGPMSAKAIFDCYRFAIADQIPMSTKALKGFQKSVKDSNPSTNPFNGCGKKKPRQQDLLFKDNASQRRVEIHFLTPLSMISYPMPCQRGNCDAANCRVTDGLRLDPVFPTSPPAISAKFSITDISGAMRAHKFERGAAFQDRWFSGNAYRLDSRIKKGIEPLSSLPPGALMEDLPFEWLFTASTRVRPVIDELVDSLNPAQEYHHLIGRAKRVLTQLNNGQIQFMKRLDALGAIDRNAKTFLNKEFNYSHASAMSLDSTSQFNYLEFGTSLWDKALDEIDDVYCALGSFIVKIAATSFTTRVENGFSVLEISEIGLYVKDYFDFNNDVHSDSNMGHPKDWTRPPTQGDGDSIKDDQLLGYWNKNGSIRPHIAIALDSATATARGQTYYRVSNDSYVKHRQTTGRGADFVVFSTVKRYSVDFIIHLNTIDFQEYIDRSNKKANK